GWRWLRDGVQWAFALDHPLLPPGSLLRRRWTRPWVEELEPRRLLAWTPLGPAPETQWPSVGSNFPEAVTGRVTSLALNNGLLYLGTAGGGVWRSTDGTFTSWVDSLYNNAGQLQVTRYGDTETLDKADPRLAAGVMAIGALAVDRTNPSVIYAGTGEANYSADSRYGAGILRSVDGGQTWSLASGPHLGGEEFFRHAVSRIIVDPNGDTI